MRRLGIFVFYDERGKVGKYVEYLLSEICQNVSDLYIISNGDLVEESRERLKKYSHNVYERENKGFDGGAYKNVICNIIGLENFKNWDELLLVNDTFYGPFWSLSNVFQEMSKSQCDFWGLSIHEENTRLSIKKHIQSYFLVIRKKLLWSDEFTEFWIGLKDINSFESAVKNFEITFTQFFAGHGYRYDALFDMVRVEKQSCRGMDWSRLFSYDLLTKHHFPVVKRKALVDSYPEQTDSLKIIQYIQEHTGYNVQLIWDDLLRRFTAKQLIFEMNLSYLIDSEKDYNIISEKVQNLAFVIRLKEMVFLDGIINYFSGLCKEIKIYILAEGAGSLQELMDKYKFATVVCCIDQIERKHFWEKITEEFDYIGYAYLETELERGYFSDYLLTNTVMENLLKNRYVVQQICKLMLENQRLGLLLPPINKSRNYGQRYVWGRDAFWVKADCLSAILKSDAKAEDASGQLMELVRQAGYYSAIVETQDYAATELARYKKFDYQTNLKKFFWTPGRCLEKFWYKYNVKYIYGTGKIAEDFTEYLCQKGWNQYEGYIVTKKTEPNQLYMGKKVWQIEELEENGIGIVLAMNEKNTKEVISLLSAKKGVHYFILRGMEFK